MKATWGFCFLLFKAITSFAQTNDPSLSFMEYGFFHPGARAAAMGGSFVGMADDATAAISNPAGLSILTKTELNVELSQSLYRNEIPWATGTQTGTIVEHPTRVEFTSSNIHYEFEPENFGSSVGSISFASGVYSAFPGKLVFSFFYNEPTSFQREFQTQGFIQSCPSRVRCQRIVVLLPVRSSLVLSLKDAGVAAGIQLTENIRFGANLTYSRLTFDSRTTYEVKVTNVFEFPLPVVVAENSVKANSSKVGFTVGGLFQPSAKIRLGLTYHHRPTHDVELETGVIGDPRTTLDHRFHTPDSYAAGASWMASENLSINVDAVRIRYSELNKGYFNAFENEALQMQEDFPLDLRIRKDFQKNSLKIEDGTEIRVGGEYSFLWKEAPLSIRAGYWREPFHSIVQIQEDAQIVEVFNEVEILSKNLATPHTSRSLIGNYHHFTFGSGFVRDRFSIDWAFDYSRKQKRFVLSTQIYI